MHFRQHYLGCLAQASYTLGSDGEAAIVDPRRDVEEYLAEAKSAGLRIKYVIETHLHADFVSGHRELQERTGAEVVFGPNASALIPHRSVSEGEELRLGRLVLRVLETPGHTPESICLLVLEGSEPVMVLTGDTLFIGDVGRPDLVGSLPAEVMAGQLYDSLHQKLLPLPDAVRVYPAHGAGSLCGRNLSTETSSTLGEQKRGNWALQPMTRDAFIQEMVRELPELPRHFARDVEINRTGASSLSALPLPTLLAPADAAARASRGATLLDVRPATDFGLSHPQGAINIGLGGQFAAWAGTLLDPSSPIVVIADEEESAHEAVLRLARVGLEGVQGYVTPASWRGAGLPEKTVPQISVQELSTHLEGFFVLDVRRPREYTSGHVPGALNIPLDRLSKEGASLDPTRPTAVICAGGYRSSAAVSLLEARGFGRLHNVTGGTSAWVSAGQTVS